MSAHNKATKVPFQPTLVEVTAQPREHTRAASIDHDDAYASLAPEELGENALRAATQSGWPPADSDAYSLGAVAASAARLLSQDDDVVGTNVWADTLDLALEFGAWVETGRDQPDFEWNDPVEATWSRDIDLNLPKVVEASLFDPGSEETMYETRAPRIHADNDSSEHVVSGDGLERTRRLRAVSARRATR